MEAHTAPQKQSNIRKSRLHLNTRNLTQGRRVLDVRQDPFLPCPLCNPFLFSSYQDNNLGHTA